MRLRYLQDKQNVVRFKPRTSPSINRGVVWMPLMCLTRTPSNAAPSARASCARRERAASHQQALVLRAHGPS